MSIITVLLGLGIMATSYYLGGQGFLKECGFILFGMLTGVIVLWVGYTSVVVDLLIITKTVIPSNLYEIFVYSVGGILTALNIAWLISIVSKK